MTAMDVDQVAAANAGAGAADMDVDDSKEAATASDKVFDDLMEKAKDFETTNAAKAVETYKAIIANKDELEDPNARAREKAIYALGGFFVTQKNAAEIKKLSVELRPLFVEIAKAKTAKIIKTLIDLMAKVPDSVSFQIEMCKDCVEWAKTGKRTFLRQRVETRLAGLYLMEGKYADSIDLLSKLNSEVKRLDDKLLLVEIALIECRAHYAVQNTAKSKASLTFSKTNANAIHCPPFLQAEIDLWSGVLAAQEKDYRTSFSYFYEAFEAYNSAQNHEKAIRCLKYMLLSKIMQNRPQEAHTLINSKSALPFAGSSIDAMGAVATAHQERSLKRFEQVLIDNKAQLAEDPIVEHHLSDLNETLLEQNILRILEPFSKVEIDHVAELVELPVPRTQAKLREMILDQKLNGTLDQGVGVLIIFDQEKVRDTYDNALKTIKNTSEVLDTLYGLAKQVA